MDNDKLGLFFENKDSEKSVPKKETINMKDFSSDWLKMKEANLLEAGDNLTSPYSQSYIVNRAVRSIAENIPQAKYKIINVSTEEPAGIDNPIVQLFMKPNSMMSRFEMWEAIGTYLNLSGEVFLFVNQSLGGVIGRGTAPAELIVVDPKLVKHTVEDGKVVGWSWNGQVPFETHELIQFKLFNPYNPIRGLSPLSAAKNEMNADYAAGVYNNQFFVNNATPDGVIEVDKDKELDIGDLRKLKAMWYENHGGPANAHKTAFLLGGMSYKSMGFTQKDMDYIQGRGFSRDAVLSVFGVHPFVAGFYDSGTVTRATAKEAKRLFWTGTLKPQLIRIEEKLAVEFFPRYAPGFVGVFDYSEVEELQDDYTEAVETAKGLFSLGYSRNEVNERLRLGMPFEDTDGATRYLPMNLVEVGTEEIDEPEVAVDIAVEPEKMVKAIGTITHRNFLKVQTQMEKILQSKIKKFIFNQRTEVLKLITGKKELTPEWINIQGGLRGIYDDGAVKLVLEVEPIYREAASVAGEMALENIGLADKQFIINEALINTRLNLVKGMNQTIYNQVKKEVFEGVKLGESINTIGDRIKAVYNTTTKRSKVIARTETASLMNGTSFDVYKQEGIKEKQWISEGDARESHQISEEHVPIGSAFSNGLMYPGDASAGPEETVNCRCSISPYIGD